MRSDFDNFKVFQDGNCFTDKYADMLYFPVENKLDFPQVIKNRVNSMLQIMINKYEKDNCITLDIDNLILNARLECYIVPEGKIQHSISITIMSNKNYNTEVLIEDEYIVLKDDPMYNEFKMYFMKRLEQELFKESF